MTLFRPVSARCRRVAAARAGVLAFGVALALGTTLGLALGRNADRRVRQWANNETRSRAEGIARQLDRGLKEQQRALRLLSLMPAVLARKGGEVQAFDDFKRIYPAFSSVGYLAKPRPGKKPTKRGPQTLRLVAPNKAGRLAGTLRASWPKPMLSDVPSLGRDERSMTTTVLFGFGGRPPRDVPQPASVAGLRAIPEGRSAVLLWSDGKEYVTSLRRLAAATLSSPDLAVVSGYPVAHMERRAWQFRAGTLLFGAFLGIVAGTVAWVGIARSTHRLHVQNDVLERRVAERTAELQAAERSFRGIFENVPLGLYQCDPEGRFLRVNPTLASTLGFESPEAMIAALGSLQAVGDLEARARFLQRVAEDGEARNAATAAQRADGRTVWLSERARAVQDESGRIAFIEGAMHDVTSQRELEDRLRLIGVTDPLTGLLNRRGLAEAVAAAGVPVSFVALDVDRFKDYNDTYGHPAGDVALRAVAAALRGALRESDVVARAGGEEFVVVLSRTGAAGAHRVAEALREAVAASRDLETRLTVSGGVATAMGLDEVEAAFAAADRALYMAKEAGRNRIVASPAKLA